MMFKISLTFIKRCFTKSSIINKFCSPSEGSQQRVESFTCAHTSWLIGPLSSLPRPPVRWRRQERFCWGSRQSSDCAERHRDGRRGRPQDTFDGLLFVRVGCCTWKNVHIWPYGFCFLFFIAYLEGSHCSISNSSFQVIWACDAGIFRYLHFLWASDLLLLLDLKALQGDVQWLKPTYIFFGLFR